MLPFYEKGGYVGGVRLRGDDIINATNKKCIVEFLDGHITIGQLQKSNKSFSYKVCTLNKSAPKKPKTGESSLEIVSAAPILWHRTFFTRQRNQKNDWKSVISRAHGESSFKGVL